MPRYTPGPVPVTEDVSQVERFLREEYESVRQSTDDIYSAFKFAVETYVAAGYGGIRQTGAPALPDINNIWQTIPFNASTVTPRGVTPDLDNDALIIDSPGVWRFNAFTSLTFVEAQGGRFLQVRLRTANAVSEPTLVPVGRNTEGATAALNFLFQVAENDAGAGIALEISAPVPDLFTGVTLNGAAFDCNLVSEYQGEFALESKRI